MRAAAEQRPAVTSWLVTARRLLFRCWRKPSMTRLIPFSPTLADTHMQCAPAFHRSLERRILGPHEAEEDYFVC
jgi:hypothetical protein